MHGAPSRSAPRREWEQFRLLCRDSIRRLVNTALFSRDADPAPTVIWTGALVMAPPTLRAMSRLFDYGVLRVTSPDAHMRAVLDDRLFFLLYAMLTVALLTGLLWEALLPDRLDLEVVGPLPVHARTLAAARFVSATLLAVGFTWATVLPSAVLFAAVSAPNTALGALVITLVAHVSAATAACLFVFFALLACRAALLLVVGSSWADGVASVLQVCTVAGLIEVVLYMPAVQGAILPQTASAGSTGPTSPPVWSAILYSSIADDSSRRLGAGGAPGVWALTLSLGTALGLSLLPARLFARRALQATATEGSAILSGP